MLFSFQPLVITSRVIATENTAQVVISNRINDMVVVSVDHEHEDALCSVLFL